MRSGSGGGGGCFGPSVERTGISGVTLECVRDRCAQGRVHTGCVMRCGGGLREGTGSVWFALVIELDARWMRQAMFWQLWTLEYESKTAASIRSYSRDASRMNFGCAKVVFPLISYLA